LAQRHIRQAESADGIYKSKKRAKMFKWKEKKRLNAFRILLTVLLDNSHF
jgi:hypothetical protein